MTFLFSVGRLSGFEFGCPFGSFFSSSGILFQYFFRVRMSGSGIFFFGFGQVRVSGSSIFFGFEYFFEQIEQIHWNISKILFCWWLISRGGKTLSVLGWYWKCKRFDKIQVFRKKIFETVERFCQMWITNHLQASKSIEKPYFCDNC